MRTLTIKSDPRHFAEVRGFVRNLAAEAKLADEVAFNMVLAVDEACANIVRHAYKDDPSQEIVITAELGLDAIEIHLRDFGRQEDAATFQPRDLDQVRPGGLGCHFIQQFFDRVSYNTGLPSGTELTLVKKIGSASAGRPDGPHQK